MDLSLKIILTVGLAGLLIWLFVGLKEDIANTDKTKRALLLQETDKNPEMTKIRKYGFRKVVKGSLVKVEKIGDPFVEHLRKSQMFRLTFLDGKTLDVIDLDDFPHPDEGIIRIECIEESWMHSYYVTKITWL